MTELLQLQAQTATALQQIVDNYTKDPSARKTHKYYVERLRRLEEQWTIFDANNTQLQPLAASQPTPSYFAKNVYPTIKAIYERYKNIFTTQIQTLAVDASIPAGAGPSKAASNDPEIEADESEIDSIDKENFIDINATANAEYTKDKKPIDNFSSSSSSQQFDKMKITVRRQQQLFEALHRMLLRINYDQPSKSYIDLKSATIQRMWSQIEENHLNICSSNDNSESIEYDIQLYIELEEQVQETLVKLHDGQVSPNTHINVNLPKITLPKFDGDYSKWVQFRDLFTQMIHKQPMAECQKLWYMKANVTGEAEKLISHLTSSSENYAAAWKTLEDRYENKRLLEAVLVNKLLSQPSQYSDSPSYIAIRTLHDVTKECLLGLKNLGVDTTSWDPLLLHILLKKLDRSSHTLFEQSLDNPKETPKISQLLKFLENRFQSLEVLGGAKRSSTQPTKPNVKTLTSLVASCICCKGQHPLFSCKSFLKLSVPERIQLVQKNKLCINCFKPGHRYIECVFGSCPRCQKRHNSLLHLENTKQVERTSQPSKIQPQYQRQTTNNSKQYQATSTASAPIALTTSSTAPPKGYVILNTAWVYLSAESGVIVKGRAILDSGSQINIITDKIARKLGVATKATSIQIEGIGNGRQTATKRASIHLLAENMSERLETYVLPTIVPHQPTRKLDISDWDIPADIILADPDFHTPGPIDVLLGAEFYHQILKAGQIKLTDGLPILQNTIFGWVVSGKVREGHADSVTCGISVQDDELNKTLEKFWRLEEFEAGKNQLTPAEKWCETHFTQTTTRTPNGRFVVKLPFAADPSTLGESKDIAVRRFLSLERRLHRNPDLYTQYAAFMAEYEALGHMRQVELHNINENHCFLPHHCVVKPDSTTTKLRVVFDASAKTTSQLSLNDILHTGPKIQDELWIMLLRFRFPQFVFSADIQKMYRQVLLDNEDQRFQMILWRSRPEQPIKCYQLATVTYGTSSAPYLAMRCLSQLAQEGTINYPLATKILQENFYVDNAIAGGNTLEEATESQKQLIELLAKAGFKLRKWSSNHPKLLEKIAIDDRESEVTLPKNNEGGVQTLGLIWIPKTDRFQIKINIEKQDSITKRSITADLARLFDPLGLLGPTIVAAKIIIQEVTKLKIDWDVPVPQAIRSKWEEFKESLETLRDIQIPRHVFANKLPATMQLHVFSDASEKAYGAAVYIRSKDSSGITIVRLLCAKSRIAPLKTQSIPRLELCAAKLGADLAHKIQFELKLKDTQIFYWTDSQIVLHWINASSSSYVTFVANRIAAIQEVTTKEQWRHVRSYDNPADALSRGMTPTRLAKEHMWFYGPLFLHGRQSEWPPSLIPIIDCDLEKKKAAAKITATASSKSEEKTLLNQINHHNSFRRLQRIMAYIMKFKNQRSDQSATAPKQLELGLEAIVRNMQAEKFAEDMNHIQRYNSTAKNSPLTSMTPFIDDKGILRAGGRLEASSFLSFDAKHPMILPYDHPLTKLLMINIHQENCHIGAQALLAKTRQRFWPIKGKTLARSVVQQCVRCARAKPRLMSQIMGNLPSPRIEPTRPFVNSGVDFCGPVWIHYQLRGKRPQKSYIAVFVCFATKVVHLEVVSNLTTEAFIAALKRFMGRRGLCKNLYCDNATNFVGARNQLEELSTSIYSKSAMEKIQTECSKRSIQFHFIPPRAPHFGGLWEAAVKVAKGILRKAVEPAALTYEQLETTLIEIEAIMNSRPIIPMSSDPNDLTALTPGHFLIGEPLTASIDPNTEGRRLQLSDRWKLICQIKNEFWRRWKTEYLQQLQQKGRWKTEFQNVKPGTMVIMKENNVPVMKWPLGRVLECHHGNDGKVRVVDVRTSSGVFRRAVHHLAPLPVNNECIPEDKTAEPPVEGSQNRQGKLNERFIELFGSESPDSSADSPPLKMTPKRHDKLTERFIELFGPESPDSSDNSRPEKRIKRSSQAETEKHEAPKKKEKSTAGAAFVTLLLATTMFPSTSAEPIHTQAFENQPGIYFDNIGKLNLVAHEWKLVLYYNLQPYWSEYHLFIKGIETLHAICEKSVEYDLCNSMTSQFKYMDEKLRKDNALLQLRQSGDTSIKSSLQRYKRGALNIIGNIANSLFGVLDDNYATEMSLNMKMIKTNEEHLLNLLRNQTSVLDATTNIMKRDEAAIDRKFKELDSRIVQLKNTVQKDNQNMAESQILSTELMITMTNIQETQDAITNILIDAQHQKISPRLVTPDQLQQQLLTIKSHLPTAYRLPADPSDLATIYKVMTAKGWIDIEQIILELTIPLLSFDPLEMFKMFPIPAILDDTLTTIKTKFPIIAISPHRDDHYMMTEHERNACMETRGGNYLCEQVRPIYRNDAGISTCEMNIFNHIPANNTCQTENLNETSMWIQLSVKNQWLYTVKPTTTLHAVCEGRTITITLQGSGILSMDPSCIAKSNQFMIYGHHSYARTDRTSYARVSINTSFAVPTLVSTSSEATMSYIPSYEEIETIKKTITTMNLQMPNEIKTDIPHHAFLSYASLAIAVVTIALVVWKIRNWTCCQKETSPQPTATVQATKVPPTQSNESAPDSESFSIFVN